MQIIHRISIASSPDIQRELARLGISVADSGFVSFDVDESNKSWPELEEWVARRRAVDVASTKFSKKEIADARWLELVPDWHHGYPQPDEDVFGYRQATYDLADWCDRCGVGMKQVAPFQMKGEPKWGKRSILQLNWVFDEYFVTPDAWALVFKPHGIECRPVLNTKGGELRSVVQLVAQGEVGVVTEGLATEETACSSCGRTKYLPVARGRFPALKEEPATAMVKTKESFGSGASAHKRVLVSQAVAHSLTAGKLRGASLRPVAERGTGS
ncbi:MAG: hypothetical protein WBP60_09295 [Gammaproteobacteria bacterium]